MKKLLPVIMSLLFFLTACDLPTINQLDFSNSSDSPVRIVQVSDMHMSDKRDLFRDTIDAVNQLDPDILLLTGDIIGTHEGLQYLDYYLSGLSERSNKYAILGNWEYYSTLDKEVLRQAYRDLGITLLVNEQDSFILNDREIVIYGLDDYLEGSPDFGLFTPSPSGLNLVLGHCPVLFDSLVSGYKDYPGEFTMFSGHTHGGQITFFGLPVVLPAGSGEYESGLYTEGNCSLYVSIGVGNSNLDFRLFADPSIEIFTY